jgi:hypothetical protein
MANPYRVGCLSAIAGIVLRIFLNAFTLPRFACLPYNTIALTLLVILVLSAPPLLMRAEFRRSAIRVAYCLVVVAAAFNFLSFDKTKAESCAPTFLG